MTEPDNPVLELPDGYVRIHPETKDIIDAAKRTELSQNIDTLLDFLYMSLVIVIIATDPVFGYRTFSMIAAGVVVMAIIFLKIRLKERRR